MRACLKISLLRELKFMAKKIIARIDGILKQINHVQEEINGLSFEEFQNGYLIPEAVSFSVSQVGERMNKLEELIGEQYPNLPWKDARKMRNIIVHDYDNVDFKKVYSTATKDLPILKSELLKIKDEIKHTSEKSLYTARLIIRPWDDFDADELFELAKEPEIGEMCGWEPHKHIRDTFFALHNFLEMDGCFAICLKESGDIIGSIGLSFGNNSNIVESDNECELGFWIGKPYWNNGYATEASKKIVEYAFENLNIAKIWCCYYEENIKSKRVQERLNFEFSHKLIDENTNKIKYINMLKKAVY